MDRGSCIFFETMWLNKKKTGQDQKKGSMRRHHPPFNPMTNAVCLETSGCFCNYINYGYITRACYLTCADVEKTLGNLMSWAYLF